ncbi:MAG: hypothetical protein ABI690_34100 [Chloroflexota bacterium]
MFKFSRLVLFILFSLIPSLITEAQSTPTLPMAGIYQGNVWVFGDHPHALTANTVQGYFDLMWSPDGTKLAFIAQADRHAGGSHSLMLWNTQDSEGKAVSIYQTYTAGFGFTADSQKIMVIDHVKGSQDLTLRMVDATPNPTVTDTNMIMPFSSGIECGGAPVNFAHSRYLDDDNIWMKTLLAQTPYGVVFAGNCFIPGDYLLHPENNTGTSLSENMQNTALSPDGTHTTGITRSSGGGAAQLAVYDLSTQTSQIIDTPVEPEIVAWGTDNNTIFYSHRDPSGTMFDGLTADEIAHYESLFADAFIDAKADPTSYESSLYRYDKVTGSSTLVYQSYAYGITNLVALPNLLIFSETQNAGSLVGSLARGQMSLPTTNMFDSLEGMIGVHLMELHLDNGHVETLATDVTQAAINVPQLASQF